ADLHVDRQLRGPRALPRGHDDVAVGGGGVAGDLDVEPGGGRLVGGDGRARDDVAPAVQRGRPAARRRRDGQLDGAVGRRGDRQVEAGARAGGDGDRGVRRRQGEVGGQRGRGESCEKHGRGGKGDRGASPTRDQGRRQGTP